MTQDVRWDDLALDELLHDPDGPVGRDLQRRALHVEETQKRLLSMHGTGRVYTTTFWTDSEGRVRPGHARPPHQASAPGEPPASDTGLLRATVSHHVDVDEQGLYADIGSGANPAIPGVRYAGYLEDGTRNIEPRPWLRPSVNAARD